MKKVYFLTTVMFATLYSMSALASEVVGNAEAGSTKIAVCATCHGKDGVGLMDNYPNLAGQKESYLASSFKAYKNGERTGKNAMLMIPMSNLLRTEQDIADVAAYYASLGKE